jgi:hypothetical protein
VVCGKGPAADPGMATPQIGLRQGRREFQLKNIFAVTPNASKRRKRIFFGQKKDIEMLRAGFGFHSEKLMSFFVR